MNNYESSENYLEAILVLGQKIPHVRSVDLAAEMNYSKASVSVALKNLRSRDLVTIDTYGFIHLTRAGLEIASSIFERHTVLSDWFISMGVDPEIAAADACRMEHHISDESFQALKKYIEAQK